MAVWTTNMYDIHIRIIIINYCCLTWAHFTCRLWPKNAAIPPRTSRTASAFPSAWVRPSRQKRRKLPKYSSTHLTTINNHTQDLSNSQQNHSTWNFRVSSHPRLDFEVFCFGKGQQVLQGSMGALRAGHKARQQITQWPQTTKEWAQKHRKQQYGICCCFHWQSMISIFSG